MGGVGVLLLGITVYILMIYTNLTETAKEMHEPIARELSNKREEPVALRNGTLFQFLY